MKNHLWKLVAVVVVLTMLVPGLAMLLAGCGPEKEVAPTPVPVKQTATPVSAAPPTDTPAPAAAPPTDTPVPPTATPVPVIPPTNTSAPLMTTPTPAVPPTDTPVPPAAAAFDKFVLWTDGTQLRGANIWQRVVVPDLDGPEFLGSGHVGPPYTQADFDRLAALGANYVNISSPGLFTEQPPYVLDEEMQANLDHLLDMIAQADMFAVITFRTGPGRSDFTFYREGANDWFDESLLIESVWIDQAAQDAWGEMWRYTAERYRDNPIVVGYDLMCEPNADSVALEIYEPDEFYPEYAGTLYDWNQFYPRITKAIREVDPDTPILVSAMGWGAVRWLSYLDPTGDPRTVYMVHQYEPQTQYTHQEPPAENAYPGEFDLDWDGNPDPFNRDWLDGYLSAIDAFEAEHGVPVAVNEFGVQRWVPGGAAFMDDQMDLFEQRGMNHALWAFNPAWPPFAENDSFDFLHGLDSDNHTEVASSDLMDVIMKYWGHNTLRPSNVAEAPTVPTTETGKAGGGLIDDFEGGGFDERWWAYTDEGTISFACTPDQPGHASAQAMRLTFEVGADSYPGCGTGVDPDQWGDAGGLSFFWRADRPSLTVVVVLVMQDPTQTNPETQGMTPFQVELQTSGKEWTPITLAWDDFAKAEWVGESGVNVLDPTRVVTLLFQANEGQSGSVWIDDLQLQIAPSAATLPAISPTPLPAQPVAPTEGPSPGADFRRIIFGQL